MAYLNEGSIGGGDVTLVGMIGFAWGLEIGVITFVLSLLFVVLYNLGYFL